MNQTSGIETGVNSIYFWEVLKTIIQTFQVKVFHYKKTGHFQGLNTSGKTDCPRITLSLDLHANCNFSLKYGLDLC